MPTKKHMVHVYLSSEEKKRVEVEAKKLGISVSAYIKIKLFMKEKI
jgi:hypothetical protein